MFKRDISVFEVIAFFRIGWASNTKLSQVNRVLINVAIYCCEWHVEEIMKLVKMKIAGFRSYGTMTTIKFDRLTTLIGDNGAGKTTLLIALNKVFGSNISDRIIRASDFYSPLDEEKKITDEPKQLSFDIYFQFEDNDTRAQAALLKRVCIEEPKGNLMLHVQLEATWTDDGSAEGLVESKVWFVTDDTDPENIRRQEASRRDLNLIRMIYVPAIRNPEKQLGATSNSLLARLIRSINWREQTKQKIETQLDELNNTLLNEKGLKEINDTLSKDWQSYYQDLRFAKVALTIDSTNLSVLANRVQSTFTSSATGRNFRPEEMGDGTRSLFYISNVATVLDIEQKILEQSSEGNEAPLIDHHPPLLTLVAIEEPENHISPHLLGKLVERLKSMGTLENCQVVLTSHSPAIVRRIDPESIRYVRLDSETGVSTIQSLKLPDKEQTVEAYRYVKLAVQVFPELYFSQLVVLGEGASEEILIPRFMEAKGYSLDEAGIVFVPLAGRFVHYLWQLLSQLRIPFITLLDLDRERSGGGWGRVSYVLGELKTINREVDLLPEGIDRITDGNLKTLETRPVESPKDASKLDNYLPQLEKENVYFSNPLDIDYLMLSHYSAAYKSLLQGSEGPRLKDREGKQRRVLDYEPDNVRDQDYVQRAVEATKSALKDGANVTDGDSYSSNEKALMIWYVYFFLGRGKPTTHIQVLEGDSANKISDAELLAGIPPVIERLCNKAGKLLHIEVEEHD